MCNNILGTLSRLSSQNFSLKKFLIFFPKKPALKKFLIFSQKKLSNFQEKEFSYIMRKVYSEPCHTLESQAYSEPVYTQNPGHIQKTVKRL